MNQKENNNLTETFRNEWIELFSWLTAIDIDLDEESESKSARSNDKVNSDRNRSQQKRITSVPTGISRSTEQEEASQQSSLKQDKYRPLWEFFLNFWGEQGPNRILIVHYSRSSFIFIESSGMVNCGVQSINHG